jgi:16S rRNA processing protein RimM
MDGMVTAGKVGGLFGNKGELTLVLYHLFPRDPAREEPVFVEIDGHRVPLFFDRFARRGVRGATAVFADIDTPARASELIGREFSIRPVPERGGATAVDEELCFEDLTGWEAVTRSQGEGGGEGSAGRITAFIDSELNPLFEVELDGAIELIPAREEFIAAIDEESRRVTFDLPEGLLGLNR